VVGIGISIFSVKSCTRVGLIRNRLNRRFFIVDFIEKGGLMTPKKGWVVPPVNGLLAPQTPTQYPESEGLGLLGYIPKEKQRNPKAKRVENHWKPEDDLPPEVLAAFKNRR
jgi:hypothetical protein